MSVERRDEKAREQEMADDERLLSQERSLPDFEDIPAADADTDNPLKNYTTVKINLTDEQKQRLMSVIRSELAAIDSEYGSYSDEYDFATKLEKERISFDGIAEYSDFPTPHAPKRKMLVNYANCQLVAQRAKRQTLESKPMILLEKLAEMDTEDLRNRQDRLDYILRYDCRIDELLELAYPYSCKHGAAVIKVPLCIEKEVYVKPDGMGGKTEEEKTTFYGVKPYLVPLEKFKARLKILDFNKHAVILEEFDYTWKPIEEKAGYYDQESIDALKAYAGEDYFKKDYKIYEADVLMNLEDDGKLRRYKITYDTASEIVLRAIYYPYSHCRIDYITIVPLPREDRWIGDSFFERYRDAEDIINVFSNSMIYEFSKVHTHIVVTDSSIPKSGLERKDFDDMSIVRLDKGSVITPMKFEYPPTDRIGFLQFFMGSYLPTILGIDLNLASGGDTPSDPYAPARKTAMKLAVSNIRVEDIIINMQKGVEKLAEQVEAIYVQYKISANETGDVEYYLGGEKKALNYQTAVIPALYICAGSTTTFNKERDLATEIRTYELFAKAFPEILNDVEVRRLWAGMILDDTNGTIEKNKKALLKPLDLAVEVKKEKMAAMERMEKQAADAGMPIDQYVAMINSGQLPPNLSGEMTPPDGAGLPSAAPEIPEMPGGGI